MIDRTNAGRFAGSPRKRALCTAVAGALLLALAGCATDHQVTSLSHGAEDAGVKALSLPANQAQVVVHHDQAYLIGQPVKVVTPVPAFLQQAIFYHPVVKVALSTATAYITSETGIAVDITALSSTSGGLGVVLGGVYPKVDVDYSGPLSGLFDTLASETGSFWQFTDGKVVFYRSLTQTFWLSTLPRKSQDSSSVSSVNGVGSTGGGGGAGGGSFGGGGGAVGGGSGSTGSSGASDNSGISAQSTYAIDPWAGIEKTAKVVAQNALVAVDPASGAITVTGSPADVSRVGQWVENLNSYYGEQVEVEMHVYNVQLSSEDNYSLSPSIVYGSSTGTLGYALTSLSAPSVQGLGKPGAFTFTRTNNATSGVTSNWNGTNAAVAALSTLGKVVETYSQAQVTTNGHPTVMQTGNSISYLYSVSNLSTANVGSATTLTPGTINTGLTTLVVPKIIDGAIHLGVTLTDSNLVSLTTATSGGSTIETPNVSSTSLQQDVILHAGDALLLTSLQGEKGSSTHNGVGSSYNPLFGGGFDASATKTLVAVVITVKVL